MWPEIPVISCGNKKIQGHAVNYLDMKWKWMPFFPPWGAKRNLKKTRYPFLCPEVGLQTP